MDKSGNNKGTELNFQTGVMESEAAEVKEEPMETKDGAEAVPKENGENAEGGGETADAETPGTILN